MSDKKSIEKRLMTRRTFVIGATKLGLLFLLTGRMFYMQFIKKDEYKTLSDKNRIKIILINAERGQIFDINKKLIAKNNNCFQLLLDKNGNPNFSLEIQTVAKIFELDNEQIKEINKMANKASPRIPTIIVDCLEWKQVSAIEERRSEFKTILIDIGFNRYYGIGTVTAHVLGYLGSPCKNENDLYKSMNKNFKVGKTGIERFYEKDLGGDFGYKNIEVNAHGRYVRELNKSQVTVGKDLYINIDSELQSKIMPYLSQQGCSAIVMDCQTGGVLVSASSPTYDPNKFNKLSDKYWNSLITNPYKPLIDKTIKSLYPPGSIFKIITMLAALEAGINPQDKIICLGGPILGDNKFRCARSRGHGPLNMIDAIKYSCNIYIYEVAKRVGADKIIEIAKRFGLGKLTNIDIPGELPGFVPTKAWKEERFGRKWGLGDTLNLSIGQGFLLSTPIQLAQLITAIASNGKLFTPKVAIGATEYSQIDIKKEYLDILKTALYNTMNTPGGTGYFSRINYKSMSMAGKTGTAQVVAKKSIYDNLSRKDIAWEKRNHAIFSGYAPFDNPKYSISIYYDHGGGGGKGATPIAKKIMQLVMSKYL